jgi:polyvinyl alcohol dehydrogenase (cytochrome)
MLHRYKTALAATLIIAVGLVACSEAPEPITPAEPEMDPAIAAYLAERAELQRPDGVGALAYQSICVDCHEGQVPKAPHRTMLELMSPESVLKAMEDGIMQVEASELTGEQRRAVAEFITVTRLGEENPYPVLMCEGDAAAFDYDALPTFPGWGMTPGNTRMMTGSNISKDTLPKLQLKWAFAYPDSVRARSQPLPAAGAIYVGSHNGVVYALDDETGCVRWSYQASAEVRTGVVVESWEAGDTSAQPNAYFGDLLGNVYAVNAVTGEEVWRDRPNDHPSATITGTPSLFDGRVYVPLSSLEVTPAMYPDYECCTFRGSLVAYDGASGDKIWETFTIEQEPTFTKQNASGTDNFGPSGAPSWNSPAIDTKRRQVYFGTGENYSSPATLTSDAIFAFDADTGDVNWTFQATPLDAWNQACGMPNRDNCPIEDGPDFDFGASVTFATDSAGQDYVLGGQKSGVVHALNPDTGELIWQTKVGRGGIQGGVHFGMATEGDKVIVPISDMPDGREYDFPDSPGLYALDLKTGEFVWKSPAVDVCEGRLNCAPGVSAAVTMVPGLVFSGAMDGHMRIHDSATGEILMDYDSTGTFATLSGEPANGGSFGGAVGPVALGNMLYMNSGYGVYFHMPGNVLLAFEVVEDEIVEEGAEDAPATEAPAD